MEAPAYTHRCPKSPDRLFTGTETCRKLRARAKESEWMPGRELCLGCEGPEPLPEPKKIDGLAGRGEPRKKPAAQTEEKKPMANNNPSQGALHSPEALAKARETRLRNAGARKEAQDAQFMAGRLTPMLRSRRDELAAAMADPDVDGAELRPLALNLISMLDAMGATGALPGWEAA